MQSGIWLGIWYALPSYRVEEHNTKLRFIILPQLGHDLERAVSGIGQVRPLQRILCVRDSLA